MFTSNVCTNVSAIYSGYSGSIGSKEKSGLSGPPDRQEGQFLKLVEGHVFL